MFASTAINSSLSPSTNAASCLLPLEFAKGSTAIDGSAAGGGGVPPCNGARSQAAVAIIAKMTTAPIAYGPERRRGERRGSGKLTGGIA